MKKAREMNVGDILLRLAAALIFLVAIIFIAVSKTAFFLIQTVCARNRSELDGG